MLEEEEGNCFRVLACFNDFCRRPLTKADLPTHHSLRIQALLCDVNLKQQKFSLHLLGLGC